MRILIVDDEPLARRRLARMLGRIRGVEVVGQAGDGVEARALIAELAPDLVLLDVQMPGLDGLSLVAEGGALPPIVFTTAHREHAVRAFELAAVDYLLKPVEPARLAQALERVRLRQGPSLQPKALEEVVARAVGRIIGARPERIAAKSGSTVHLLDAAALSRLYASDKYTLIHHDGEEYVLDESLHELEARLEPLGFLRVHRRELINLAKVRALHHEELGTVVELDDGQRARVSRRALAALKARLGLR